MTALPQQILPLGDLLIGVLFTTVIVNMPYFTERSGVSEWGSTLAYSTFLAVQALGIFIFGAAADKFKIRRLMIFCLGDLDILHIAYAQGVWPAAVGGKLISV